MISADSSVASSVSLEEDEEHVTPPVPVPVKVSKKKEDKKVRNILIDLNH